MEGQLFFSRNEYFINLEENEKNLGIADRNEGSWSREIDKKTKKLYIEEDGKMLPLDFLKATWRQRVNALINVPICCFVSLSINDDFEIIPNENALCLKKEVQTHLIEQFQSRNLVILADTNTFIERIFEQANKLNIAMKAQAVTYYKGDNHPLTEQQYNSEPLEALFYKSDFFAHQKEFRVVMERECKDNQFINIGNIEDIAMNLGVVQKESPLPLKLNITQKETQL